MHLIANIKNAFVYNFKIRVWDEHSVECRFLHVMLHVMLLQHHFCSFVYRMAGSQKRGKALISMVHNTAQVVCQIFMILSSMLLKMFSIPFL